MKIQYAIAALVSCILIGCEKVVLLSTPTKKPVPSNSTTAKQAENYFWTILHQGRYQQISQSDYLLMAAYLQNPHDPKLAAHLGFLHIWKITERNRNKQISPKITNEIILAKKYFSDAVELEPSNPIYQGFFGDAELIEGRIFQDKREEVRGYFALKRAIRSWPEFNLFTAGYPMSSLPTDSEYFKKALEWQWQTLDLCAGTKINRKDPNYFPYLNKRQDPKARACVNSWVAPHNFEGFFMNMGDMLVKSGDWQTGVKIYQSAKLINSYSRWPYQKMLEDRIKNARENVSNFQKELPNPDKTILFNSGYGCVICHQN